MNRYRTVQGDDWEKIAYKVLGDENQVSELLSANEEYAGIVIFSAGVILSVPEPEYEVSETLPPWKRL